MVKLCELEADLSKITPTRHFGLRGMYWSIDYEIMLFFNGAKLQGRLVWEQNVCRSSCYHLLVAEHFQGRKHYGPVTVIPASLF
jgi:hypothetical protein